MRRAALVVPFVLVAWALSRAPLRGDDIGFAMWSLTTPLGQAPAGPPWHTYVRPLEYLTWWACGRADLGMGSARAVLAVAWVATLAVLAGRAKDDTAALAAVVMVGLAPVYQDLLTWRSFLSRAVVLLAIVSVPRHPLGFVGVGFLAVGFKEPGALAVAMAGLARLGRRELPLGLVLLVALVSIPSWGKVGTTLHLAEYLHTLGDFAFVTPLLVAWRWPGAHAGWLVAAAAASVVPWLGGVVVLLVLAAALSSLERVLVAIPWLVVLPGVVTSRQYLLEGWLLAVSLLTTRPGPRRPLAFALAVLAAVPPNVAYLSGRAGLVEAWREQVAFLRDFQPPPARILYFPTPGWDLDALVWVRAGATLGDTPPPGVTPDHVGPRSGVWALE